MWYIKFQYVRKYSTAQPWWRVKIMKSRHDYISIYIVLYIIWYYITLWCILEDFQKIYSDITAEYCWWYYLQYLMSNVKFLFIGTRKSYSICFILIFIGRGHSWKISRIIKIVARNWHENLDSRFQFTYYINIFN